MKALFFTLVFQFLFQFMSLNVFASEFRNSDSVLIESNLYKNEISLSSNLVSKKQLHVFENLNVKSDTTKKEETTIEANKKPKKDKGKLLSVLTFLSGGLSVILSMIVVVMGMTGSAGTLLVLGIVFGLAFLALIMGYFSLKKLKKWNKQNNYSHTFYHLLAAAGIACALIPIGFVLFVFALIVISLIQGNLYM